MTQDSSEARKPARTLRARRSVVFSLLGLLILIGVAILWGADLKAVLLDRERITRLVAQAGPWGPVALIGLTIAQVIAAPIPGQVVNFVAGYLFGFWAGALYSWGGTVAGSTLAILMARSIGRTLVIRFVKPATLDRLDRYASSRGLAFFLLLFALPFLPDDIACFVAGMTPLPLSSLVLVVAVGRLPGVFGAVWVGTHMTRFPWQVWAAGAGLLIVFLFVAARHGDKLQWTLLNWLGGRHPRGGRQPSDEMDGGTDGTEHRA